MKYEIGMKLKKLTTNRIYNVVGVLDNTIKMQNSKTKKVISRHMLDLDNHYDIVTPFVETDPLPIEPIQFVGIVESNNETATKHDQEKIPLELLSPIALDMIAEVMAFGAKKYAAHNWRRGMSWSRLLGASLRHILAYLGGEDKDPESGLSHLAHAGCCIMFLLEYIAKGLGKDDRYK